MEITEIFPTINASLNGLAGLMLLGGFQAIKNNKPELHKRFMISALLCSAVFLVCYLTYHYLKQGVVTHYEGEGIWRVIYFTILLTHTPLAALVPPAAIVAVIHARKGRLDKHMAITRWLYPVWMYVSVTGVLIYLMLYIF